MMRVENRNILIWALIMISGYLLFSASFGALFGLYGGLKIAGPIAVELSKSGDIGNIQSKTDLTADQRNAIEKRTIEQMRKVNWWLWWPLLSTIAWLITSLFLGFMKVVKFNVGLVGLTYIALFLKRRNEWNPPGNIAIEVLTILLALAMVHFMSRWICSKRIKA